MGTLPDSLKDYTYAFEESSIAHFPSERRDESRLLLVRRNPEKGLPRFEDLKFSELPRLVDEIPELKKYLWVRNRSRVLPARIFARRATGSRHEIVLTEKVSEREWKALIKNVAKVKIPETLTLEGSNDTVTVVASDAVRFEGDAAAIVEKVGRVPLPPYIKREVVEADRDRYQTVWAQGEALSAAAPTASLHFTEELWQGILSKGVQSADAYLHVGRGTFEALRTNILSQAELHFENYEIAVSELQKIQQAEGVLAIGTTACRLTESLAASKFAEGNALGSASINGKTNLFIKPGYEFLRVRALLTNFHLPESSLFVLVSVFAGSLELAKEAYEYALSRKYRLFSYGDSSLWI